MSVNGLEERQIENQRRLDDLHKEYLEYMERSEFHRRRARFYAKLSVFCAIVAFALAIISLLL
jgi:hypothetical protein